MKKRFYVFSGLFFLLLFCQNAYALTVTPVDVGSTVTVQSSSVEGRNEVVDNARIGPHIRKLIKQSDIYWSVLVVNVDLSKAYTITMSWPIDGYIRMFGFSGPDIESNHDGFDSLNMDPMDPASAKAWNCSADGWRAKVSFDPTSTSSQLLILYRTREPGLYAQVTIEETTLSDEQINCEEPKPFCSNAPPKCWGFILTEKLTGENSTDNGVSSNATPSDTVGFEDQGGNYWIEAEDESSTSIQAPGTEWDSHEETGQPGRAGHSGAGDWYLSRGGDTLYYTIDIPQGGTYYLWCRDYSDNAHPAGARGISVAIDSVHLGSFPENSQVSGFAWHKLTSVDLTAGQHTIAVTKSETTTAAAILDAFMLTKDLQFSPTGMVPPQDSSGAHQKIDETLVAGINGQCSTVVIDSSKLTDLQLLFEYDSDDLNKWIDYYFILDISGAWFSLNSDGVLVPGIVPMVQGYLQAEDVELLNLTGVDFSDWAGQTFTLYSGYVISESGLSQVKYDCRRFDVR